MYVYKHFSSTKVPTISCRITQGKFDSTCTCPVWWRKLQQIMDVHYGDSRPKREGSLLK